MNIRISLSIFGKEPSWTFDAECIESVQQFRNTVIVTILRSNPWRWTGAHLLRYRYSLFQQCFVFSEYKLNATFIKLIPKYFILLDAISEIVLFSYLECLLKVYKVQLIFVYWHILPVCWTNLLVQIVLLVDSLGFSICKIISFANSFTSYSSSFLKGRFPGYRILVS